MRCSRGFTLIELLVVLVILGSLVGLAVLSTGIAGPARELNNEAERLTGLIGVLADEAVLDNREYGLRLSPEAYQVLRYDEVTGKWLAFDKVAHRLPSWAVLSFELDGEVLSLPAPAAQDDKKAKNQAPQLLILSSGELSSFRLRLAERRKDGLQLQISSDGFRLPRIEVEVGATALKGRAG